MPNVKSWDLRPANIKILKAAIAAELLVCVALFVVRSLHWPLVGDASLIHYVAFLMQHGRVPYREIGDMNMPGCYVPDWLITRFFGISALAWRVYDLLLLAIAACAMAWIARPYGKFPAIWAGSLFALIHGRDGIDQIGQRDLTAAILLLIGVAFLLVAKRTASLWNAVIFGLCAGSATTIKPTLAPFILLAACLWFGRTRNVYAAIAGWLVPLAACVLWLWRMGALAAFWNTVTVLAPYHAHLAQTGLGAMLDRSIAPLAVLIAIWLLLWVVAWRTPEKQWSIVPERTILLLAAAAGYLSYLLQARGFPYHRYPFFAFLLVVIAIDLTLALRAKGLVQWIALAGLVCSSLIAGPTSVRNLSHYYWTPEVDGMLRADLDRIAGGNLHALDGRVQCLDTVSGCINTLFDLQLPEATGTMYDEFLFHPAGPRAVNESRASFLAEIDAQPPQVIIVSAELFPDGPHGYGKLAQWPEFTAWLDQYYILDAERQPIHPVWLFLGRPVPPFGYRLYVRRWLPQTLDFPSKSR